MPKPQNSGNGKGGKKDQAAPLSIDGFSPDTGVVGDGITAIDDGLVFSGTGDGTQVVYFYVDGVAIGEVLWAQQPNPDGSYDWSYTLSRADLVGAGLSAEGTYEITIGFETTSKNGRSTKTTFSDPYQLTIDQTVTGTIDQLSLDTGMALDDWLTQDNTPVVSGTGEAGATVRLQVASVADNWTNVSVGTVAADGTWTLTATGPNETLADGDYLLTVEVEDLAGNVITLTKSLTVDTTTVQPTVTGEAVTEDATPGFSGTAEAYSTVEVFANGQSVGTAATDSAGTWQLADSSVALSDGNYEITAVATDLAGNVSSVSAPLSITVDAVPDNPGPPPPDGGRRQPTDPLYLSQWHLNMLDDQGDTEWAIEKIWNDYTAAGVSVAIFDDGVEYSHPDLDDNYDASRHLTYLGEVLDAAPTTSDEGVHGTAVAGVIGAEANGEGSVGIAFGASLTGVNIFSGPANINDLNPQGYVAVADEQYRFDVVNHSWGALPVYINDLSDVTIATLDGWQRATSEGRDGYGSIIVKAAGNSADSAHGDALNNSRFAIIGGAHDWEGDASWYTNRGPSLLVSAPTSGNTDDGDLRIITTDRQGGEGYAPDDYTGIDQTGFGGTSSAAPTIAGVVALMLDANPELGWRDVQTILSYSAHGLGTYDGPLADPYETLAVDEDGDGAVDYYTTLPVEYDQWIYNGADNWNGGGLHYSGDYGYGGVDVYNAVRMAEVWSLLGTAQTSANEVVVEDIARVIVPDDPNDPYASLSYNAHGANGEPDTVAATWTYSGEPMMLEYVSFSLEIELIYMEGLTMTLTSPEGTTATLMEPLLNDYSPLFTFLGIPIPVNWSWNFGVEAFRGEDPNGDWTLTLHEVNSTYDTENYPGFGELEGGKVNWFEFDFYGQEESVDDIYHYTDEVFDAMSDEPERMSLADDGGQEWLNLAAMTGDLTVDLASDGTGGAAMAGSGAFIEIAAGTVIENVVSGDVADVLLGNDGANRLYGMRGSDTISGDAGDDFLSGGTGEDLLTGGSGNDQFEFVPGSGVDTITDFTAGAGTDDTLVLSSNTPYSLSNLDGDAWVDFGGGDGFLLQGVDYQLLHQDDFFYV